MGQHGPAVLILGSGPNVQQAQDWLKSWFDKIVAVNNAWQVRPDWDLLVFPEDFAPERMPPTTKDTQRLVEADAFVPAQNVYGGFVFAGATMAYTTGYWALASLQPRVMAFMGCDMKYPSSGKTHFYGTGTADPLRDDVTLRDLGAKSARLALIAASEGCACVNLSTDPSSLLFQRAKPQTAGGSAAMRIDAEQIAALRAAEDALGYLTPDGRYDVQGAGMNVEKLDAIDAGWLRCFHDHTKA